MRALPNILICGTPAVGKTTTITHLLSLLPGLTPPVPSPSIRHLSITDLVKSHPTLSTTFSNKHDSYLIDDDTLMDAVSDSISDGNGEGGWVIDWHSAGGFATRWIDLVVVLRCEDTSVLYDRLMKRGYKEEKVQENLDAEIFGVVSEEAKEGWGDEEEKVVELRSESVEDVESNAERVLAWMQKWAEDRKEDRAKAEG